MSVQLAPFGGGLSTTLLYTYTKGSTSIPWSSFYSSLDIDDYDWYLIEAKPNDFTVHWSLNENYSASNYIHTSQWVSKEDVVAMNESQSNVGLIMLCAYDSWGIEAYGICRVNNKLGVSTIFSEVRIYGVTGIK